MSWRVLVSARAFWVSGQQAEERLNAAGCTIVRTPVAGPLAENDLIGFLAGGQAMIASSDPFTERVFAACPDLLVVSRCGVGIDSVDLAAATRAGVLVTNTPGTMTEAVADYTFGLIFAIARRIPESDKAMRAGGWGEFPGVLVCGKTLGLIGFGKIGQGVARRAAGFGMTLLVHDPIVAQQYPDGQHPDTPQVRFVDLKTLMGQSDFVSVHAPAVEETRGLINAERLSWMKPSAYLVNTARGSLIDEPALIAALEAGTIAGAALDVYTEEPLPADRPIRKAPRTVLTPHNAFNAAEAAAAMSGMAADNVLALMRGERVPNVCNPEVWESPGLRLR